MNFTDKSCRDFVGSLSGKDPVPGGGGASALVGSLAAALGNMVGSLTVGKKKYADVEEDMKARMQKTEKLQEELGAILGLRAGRTAILLGAGNLGRALLNNFNFSASGFELLCAFDASPELIGRSFGGYEVRDAKELDHYIDELHPDVAVLTIPRGNAPAIARSLVERGIRGLWNFTGEDLHLEGLGVPVENVHLSDSLMTLCQLVGMAEENED